MTLFLLLLLPIVEAQQNAFFYDAPSSVSNASWMKCDGVMGEFSAQSNFSFQLNATSSDDVQAALFSNRAASRCSLTAYSVGSAQQFAFANQQAIFLRTRTNRSTTVLFNETDVACNFDCLRLAYALKLDPMNSTAAQAKFGPPTNTTWNGLAAQNAASLAPGFPNASKTLDAMEITLPYKRAPNSFVSVAVQKLIVVAPDCAVRIDVLDEALPLIWANGIPVLCDQAMSCNSVGWSSPKFPVALSLTLPAGSFEPGALLISAVSRPSYGAGMLEATNFDVRVTPICPTTTTTTATTVVLPTESLDTSTSGGLSTSFTSPSSGQTSLPPSSSGETASPTSLTTLSSQRTTSSQGGAVVANNELALAAANATVVALGAALGVALCCCLLFAVAAVVLFVRRAAAAPPNDAVVGDDQSVSLPSTYDSSGSMKQVYGVVPNAPQNHYEQMPMR